MEIYDALDDYQAWNPENHLEVLKVITPYDIIEGEELLVQFVSQKRYLTKYGNSPESNEKVNVNAKVTRGTINLENGQIEDIYSTYEALDHTTFQDSSKKILQIVTPERTIHNEQELVSFARKTLSSEDPVFEFVYKNIDEATGEATSIGCAFLTAQDAQDLFCKKNFTNFFSPIPTTKEIIKIITAETDIHIETDILRFLNSILGIDSKILIKQDIMRSILYGFDKINARVFYCRLEDLEEIDGATWLIDKLVTNREKLENIIGNSLLQIEDLLLLDDAVHLDLKKLGFWSIKRIKSSNTQIAPAIPTANER